MNKCIGCGVVLQNIDKDKLGYISDKNKNLCTRCFRLTHYGEYKQVNLTNEDYIKIINNIPTNSLVLYISDILSLDIPKLNKHNNNILVITKRDIMPKSIKDEKIIEYIKTKHNNIKDVIIISSKNNYNIDNLYNIIKKYSKKEIYLIGNTNSGKSTLINKLLNNYTDNKNNNVTVSMYPSTTLDKIIIKLNEITLIDTPGLIDNGNIINYINSKDLKLIIPKKEIKPKSCQIKGIGSLLIGNYARIDYETNTNNSIVIYTSNMINIRFASPKSDTLKDLKCNTFNLSKEKDIVIPGLGFVKCKNPLKVKLYVLPKVLPYERDNLI